MVTVKGHDDVKHYAKVTLTPELTVLWITKVLGEFVGDNLK
jgi:hypothetical protein